MTKKSDGNLIILVAIIIIYIAGQFLIGTYHTPEKRFIFDAPSDVDFLYYGSIANTLLTQFPPDNPAFSGERLTQPFLQFYPLAILSKVVNPYNGVRILNVFYILLLGLVLKHLFPEKYGPPLLLFAAASTIMANLNSLGVDLIARGFTHSPFFILLTIALVGRKTVPRAVSIFLAALLNGYIMLIIVPYLLILAIWKRSREQLILLLSSLVGLFAASLLISSLTDGRPLYLTISESFRFDPTEIMLHAVPILILLIIYRNREMAVLLFIAVIFGAFVHYNPFFPIFIIYFSGAMIVANGDSNIKDGDRLAALVLGLLFLGFIISAYNKYEPGRGDFYPRFDSRLTPALEWAKTNTGADDCFLSLTADAADLALVMQYRPVYLGYIEHLSHLGINWNERYQKVLQFAETGRAPENVKYIFWGPIERKYFPATKLNYPPAYQDSSVTIYKAD